MRCRQTLEVQQQLAQFMNTFEGMAGLAEVAYLSAERPTDVLELKGVLLKGLHA